MSDPRVQALADAQPPDSLPEIAKVLYLALNYLQACVRNKHEDVFQTGALEIADTALAAARGKEISQE